MRHLPEQATFRLAKAKSGNGNRLVNIHLLVTGRSYQAAQGLPRELRLPDGCSLDEALQSLASLMPAGQGLDGNCLVAVSGMHMGTVRGHRAHVLCDGDELAIIAPVAGG